MVRKIPAVIFPLGIAKFRLDTTWVVLAALLLLGITGIYIPLFDNAMSTVQTWAIAAVILILVIVSLVAHVMAHVLAARAFKEDFPNLLSLYILADPAQSWSYAKKPSHEVLIAFAGPLVQFLLAAFCFFVWNFQIGSFTNLGALFLAFFNLFVGMFNLIPVFPLDGGRLLRAIVWGMLGRPARGTWLARWAGFWLIIAVALWGIILISQQARLEWEAGEIAFAQAGLMAISYFSVKAASQPPLDETAYTKQKSIWRSAAVALLILPLAAVIAGAMPINYGLEAPGITADVEPMVGVPAQYNHSSQGSLILTSVIPQAPILLAEWIWGHFDKSVRLLPEENVFPPNQSVQSQAEESQQMLFDSETTAAVVGLRLAGFPVATTSDGMLIESILADSPASNVLKLGDVISAVNQQPVNTIADIQNLMKGQNEVAEVQLTILRQGQTLNLVVGTLPPAVAGGPVRIGIGGETHVTGFTLPFPVEISPEKIIGGPSAGLMFTLAVYDRVTIADLTKGYRIAGTGTIDLDGNVGEIGGVQQKVAAAERAGAQYFLTPVENFPDASIAAKKIIVVPVKTAQEAIDFLNSLPPGRIVAKRIISCSAGSICPPRNARQTAR